MPIRILIIEDEPDHAFLTKTILEQANSDFRPEYELDPKKGLQRVIDERPDVILCDYRLPEMSGYDILMELKKLNIDIPFIVVTASGNEKIAVEFMKSGASDYILKDVAYAETLNVVIEKALQRHRTIKEKQRLEKEIREAYDKLKKTQNELIQSEKMAALGAFSSGVAHEVKNPLGVILGGIEFLDLKLPKKDEDVIMAIEKIKEATLRADNIIQGLLKFARPSELKIEKISGEELIDAALSLIKYRCPPQNIDIKTKYTDDHAQVKVDKNQIQQVLFNALVNAVEAMPQGGSIEIATKAMKQCDHLNGEAAYLITISDSGEGIPQENLSKLFVPFFTTKREGQGTGLGLSIAKTIVDNHGGSFFIENNPGQGAVVIIALPLSEASQQ